MIDYIKSLPTHVIVIGAVVIYIVIGVIVSYIAGRLDASDDLMAIGVLWIFVIPIMAILGVLWIFVAPFRAGQKHSGKLPDEEAEKDSYEEEE